MMPRKPDELPEARAGQRIKQTSLWGATWGVGCDRGPEGEDRWDGGARVSSGSVSNAEAHEWRSEDFNVEIWP